MNVRQQAGRRPNKDYFTAAQRIDLGPIFQRLRQHPDTARYEGTTFWGES